MKIIIAPDVDIERTYSGPLKKKENVAATLDLIKNSIGIKYKVIGEKRFYIFFQIQIEQACFVY